MGIIFDAEFENLIFDFLYYDRCLISFACQLQRRIAAAGRPSVAPEWEADVGDVAAVEEIAAGAVEIEGITKYEEKGKGKEQKE